MSQIRTTSLILGLLLPLCLLCLSGCGDTNSNADLDPNNGKHPATWLPSGHSVAANDHAEECTQCHGSDFTGGSSNIACTQCHLGNQNSIHPGSWGQFAYALHGSYVTQNGNTSCANASCHGTDLAGIAASGPSCQSCHLGGVGSAHPIDWIPRFTTAPGISPTNLPDHGDYVNANGSASCVTSACHGPGGEGVFLSGRSCRACHV